MFSRPRGILTGGHRDRDDRGPTAIESCSGFDQLEACGPGNGEPGTDAYIDYRKLADRGPLPAIDGQQHKIARAGHHHEPGR